MIDLTTKDLQIVKQILQKHLPNIKVVAFGSRVTGKAKPYSDLDLCIMTKQPLSLKQFADLREDFSESDLPFRVDLIDWSSIALDFQAVVKAQCEDLV